MKIVIDFIYKFINESVFNYSFEANFEILSYLFYIKVHRMNFSDFYKNFYTFKNNVFTVLFLIINVVIKPVFAFII